jgi:hypothetical protein
VSRRDSDGRTVACVAFDVSTLEPQALTPLGRLPEVAEVRSFRLVDGAAVLRLSEEDVHFVVHPLGHVMATVRSGIVDTYAEGKAVWRGVL